MRGPPVKPKRRLAEMPGIKKGTFAKIQPKTIPKKIGIKLGLLRRFIELPNTCST